jgi:hypothetical protein
MSKASNPPVAWGKADVRKNVRLLQSTRCLLFVAWLAWTAFVLRMCVDVDSAIFAKTLKKSKVKIMYFKQKETAVIQIKEKLPPYYAVLLLLRSGSARRVDAPQ